ncbi:hypothetical protein niasHT_005619 [Heterodera trifolii]|uniref:EF-hand domain-containing protein n=1 Tax=Heterodera trifolii TaxID=157864 RepID=A0ABD2M932_9BILA
MFPATLRFSLQRANRFSQRVRRGTKKLAKKSDSSTAPPAGDSAGAPSLAGQPTSGGEVDNSSMDELSRFEPSERPPTLAQIQEMTAHRFSEQWIKYIYNRFKNECPTGRMKFAEFRRLFGVFIPDRVSDAYLERMFYACQQSCCAAGVAATALPSSHNAVVDYLTFSDLVVALHRLCDENARANAEWTVRLIAVGTAPTAQQQYQQQHPQQQISFTEFLEFVRAVFALRGRSDQCERKRKADSLLVAGTGGGASAPPQQRRGSTLVRKATIVRSAAMFASAITAPTAGPAIAHFGRAQSSSGADGDAMIRTASEQRALVLFKELDMDEKGFLTTNDFEQFFACQQKPMIFVS